MSTYAPYREAIALFRATWFAEPQVIASAPGRVNLIGEHTDYNDGFVLPMAINRRTVVAVGSAPEPGLHLISAQHPAVVTVHGPPWRPQGNGAWVNYPVGVIAELEAKGVHAASLRVAVASDVPIGAGLSSSAALETAVATALAGLYGLDFTDREIALLCQRAEHAFAGVRCGIMDQMAAAVGGVLMIDCRTLQTRASSLPEGVRVAILDSGIPRGLSGSAYNERRSQCERGVALMRARWPHIRALRDVTPEMLARAREILPEVIYRRCRHVVTENQRVEKAAEAMERGDAAELGRLFGESHASMRDDYEISLPEIDRLVEIAAQTPGCFGARLTGAGFGGAVVALIEARDAERRVAEIIARYRAETDKPGSAMLVKPDTGARVETKG